MPARDAASLSAALVPARDADHLRGVLLVALAGTFWSLSGILVRWIEAASPWQIIFYRSVALALTLLVIIALRHEGRIARAFAQAGWNALIGGSCLASGFIGFIFALHHTTVASAVFMLGAAPFFAALLGRWILGEQVRRATWLAMAIAALGLGTMVGDGLTAGTFAGSLFSLGASLSFALFTVCLRRGGPIDTMPSVVHAGVVGALVSGGLLLGADGGAGLAVSGRDLLLCTTMGVVQMGLGLTVYTLGARHLPAAELNLLSMTELVLSPLWVWLGVGEVPSGYTLLGGAVLMTAIAYQALSGAKRRRTAPPMI